MVAYYNEIDPFAAAWLRDLIRAGHIAHGDVDERSIVDVRAADLAGYTQCHFFAGIGGWSHALRNAGWPDDRPVWTGSCPCQPFSVAGQRKGHDDERHLWPAFHGLIAQCRPAIVIGEQVAGKDGREWLAAVRADLEADGYACGGADLSAAGVGAPHIRQRLYWVADAAGGGRQQQPGHRSASLRRAAAGAEEQVQQPSADGAGAGGLADADQGQRRGLAELRGTERDGPNARRTQGDGQLKPPGDDGGLANSECNGWRAQRQWHNGGDDRPVADADGQDDRPLPPDGFWRDADWLGCRDGRWRPVEPGTFPLAHGVPARVGRLRGYGNAIVAPLAQVFIEAVMEILSPSGVDRNIEAIMAL